jgi:hypothetical protein
MAPPSLSFYSLASYRDYRQYTQSTRVSVPSSELGPPPPTQESVSLPLYPKGGREKHSLAGEGVGGPNSDDWTESTESMAFCILCGSPTLACREGGRAGGPKSYDRTETLVLYTRCSLYSIRRKKLYSATYRRTANMSRFFFFF